MELRLQFFMHHLAAVTHQSIIKFYRIAFPDGVKILRPPLSLLRMTAILFN